MLKSNRKRRRRSTLADKKRQARLATERKRLPQLESLEARQMLTASVEFTAGLNQLTESATSGGPMVKVTNINPVTGITGTPIERTVFVIPSAPAPSASVTPAESNDYKLQSFEFPEGWGKGSTTKIADIMTEGWFSITNDQFFEGAESVNINIVGVGGSAGKGISGVGPQSTHQHIILDNESATSIALQSNAITEGNITHSVGVTLTLKSEDFNGKNRLPATLEPAAAGGTGITGTLTKIAGGTAIVRTKGSKAPWDTQEIPNQSVTFPAGAGVPSGSKAKVISTVSSAITITTIDDNIIERNETINFDFINFPPNLPINAITNKVVTIADNESATVTLDKAVDTAEEDAASAAFNIVNLNLIVTPGATLADDLTIPVTIGGSASFNPAFSDYGFVSPPIGSVTLPHPVTFAKGSGSSSVQFKIDAESGTRDDSILEGNETVTLTLGKDSGGIAKFFNKNYQLTITDDEIGKLTVKAVGDITEGGTAQYNVALVPVSPGITGINKNIDLTYTLGGTANGKTDYNDVNKGKVTLTSAGKGLATISIPTIDENLVEPTETLVLNLQPGTSGLPIINIDNSINIKDNDTATVSIFVTKASGVEDKYAVGDKNNQDPKFVAKISNPASVDTIVNIGVGKGGTASSGDHLALPASVTIPAGKTVSNEVTVGIIDDNIVEKPETLLVKATGIASSDPDVKIDKGNDTGALTFLDNDSATISLTTSDPFASEPNDNGQFLLSLDRPVSTALQVEYTIAGSATVGKDHTLASGVTTIAPNTLHSPIAVPILDDLLLEGTETVKLTLIPEGKGSLLTNLDGQAVTLKQQTSTLDILDNEANPVVSIVASPTGKANEWREGDAKNNQIKYTISIPNPTVNAVKVTLGVKGTATPGVDYTPGTATLTTPFFLGGGGGLGATSKTFTLTSLEDLAIEGDETAVLFLSKVVGGIKGTSSATGTIVDNDNAKIVVTGGANAAENPGQEGTFTVSLIGGPSTTDTVVQLAATGTATQGQDYNLFKSPAGKNALVNNQIKIPAGKSAVSLWARGIDDKLVEGNETITLTASKIVSGATSIGVGAGGTITIFDDDTAFISIAASDGIASETPLDQGRFVVTVDNPNIVHPMTINYQLSTGSKNADHSDLISLVGIGTTVTIDSATKGSFTIAPGVTKVEMILTAADDLLVEGIEDFDLNLTGVVSPTTLLGVGFDPSADNAKIAILDNDKAEVFLAYQSLSDKIGYEEINANGDNVVPLFVGLTQPSSTDTVVTFSVGVPGTLTADAEFGTGLIGGTIGADDFSINGTSQHVFCKTGTAPCTPVTPGTFKANPVTGRFDYQIVVKKNTLFSLVNLQVNNDAVVEGTEFANVALQPNASSNKLYTNSAVLNTVTPMIQESDTAVIRVSDFHTGLKNAFNNQGSLTEGDNVLSGSVFVQSPIEGELTVNVIPVNGTATSPSDYSTGTQTFLFVNTLSTSQPIAVDAVDDALFEPTESYSLTLAAVHNNNGAVNTKDVGSVQILDDDRITLNLGSSINEGKAGKVATLNGTITLNGTVAGGTTFTLQTKDGTAMTPGPLGEFDYQTVSGSALWGGKAWTKGGNSFGDNDGNSTLSFQVRVNGDNFVEADQTFTLTVSSSDPTIQPVNHTITIVNDDTLAVSLNKINVSEGAGTTGPVVLTTNERFEGKLTVQVNTVDGSATASTNKAKNNNDYVNPGNIKANFTNPLVPVNNAISGGVTIHQDTIAEGDESFSTTFTSISLVGNKQSLPFSTKTGTVKIIDDDNITFTVTPNPVKVSEGDGLASFTVKLIPGLANGGGGGKTTGTVPITINPNTVNGTATGGADFTKLVEGSQPLSFTALNQTQTVNIGIVDDLVIEAKENFSVTFPAKQVNVTPGTSFSLPPTVGVSIAENDSAVVHITNEQDGTEGGPNGSFDIGLFDSTGTIPYTTDVDVFVSVVVSGTATPDFDYTLPGTNFSSTKPTLLVVLPADTHSLTVPVAIVDDGIEESTETVLLTENNVIPAESRAISSPTPGSAADTGTVNINDNDGFLFNPPPTDVSVRGTGWNAGVSSYSFTTNGTADTLWQTNIDTFTVTYPSIPTLVPNMILEGPSAGGIIPTITSWTPGTTTATFTTFSPLANGHYKATIDGGITSAPLNFSVLQADSLSDSADIVGFTDFAVFAGSFGLSGLTSPHRADYDASGDIVFTDFAVFLARFGTDLSTFVTPAPTSGGSAEPLSAMIEARDSAQDYLAGVDSVFAEEDDENQEEIYYL